LTNLVQELASELHEIAELSTPFWEFLFKLAHFEYQFLRLAIAFYSLLGVSNQIKLQHKDNARIPFYSLLGVSSHRPLQGWEAKHKHLLPFYSLLGVSPAHGVLTLTTTSM